MNFFRRLFQPKPNPTPPKVPKMSQGAAWANHVGYQELGGNFWITEVVGLDEQCWYVYREASLVPYAIFWQLQGTQRVFRLSRDPQPLPPIQATFVKEVEEGRLWEFQVKEPDTLASPAPAQTPQAHTSPASEEP